jgi:hypothetical protein
MSESMWYKIQNRLDQNLREAEAGEWDEKSTAGDPNSPANPKIMEVFTDAGFPDRAALDKSGRNKDGTYGPVGDKTAWCAAYAGSVLKGAGSGYLAKNLSAVAYNEKNNKWGGKPIGRRNYKDWRENDVLVMEGEEGGGKGNHVAFVKAVDPKNNRFMIVGGNQGDTVSEGVYYNLSKVYNVFRGNWTVPKDKDVPIIKDLSSYPLRNSTR